VLLGGHHVVGEVAARDWADPAFMAPVPSVGRMGSPRCGGAS